MELQGSAQHCSRGCVAARPGSVAQPACRCLRSALALACWPTPLTQALRQRQILLHGLGADVSGRPCCQPASTARLLPAACHAPLAGSTSHQPPTSPPHPPTPLCTPAAAPRCLQAQHQPRHTRAALRAALPGPGAPPPLPAPLPRRPSWRHSRWSPARCASGCMRQVDGRRDETVTAAQHVCPPPQPQPQPPYRPAPCRPTLWRAWRRSTALPPESTSTLSKW